MHEHTQLYFYEIFRLSSIQTCILNMLSYELKTQIQTKPAVGALMAVENIFAR